MAPFVVSYPNSHSIAARPSSVLPHARPIPTAPAPTAHRHATLTTPSVLPASLPLVHPPSHGASPEAAGRSGPSVLLFRNDLRLHDNPSIEAAFKRSTKTPVLLYVFDSRHYGAETTKRSVHEARFLIQAVESLRADVEARGGVLIVRCGPVEEVLAEVCDQVRAKIVYAGVTADDNREDDQALRANLEKRGVDLISPSADAISALRSNGATSSSTSADSIEAGALEFREHPERFVKFLDRIPEPDRLDGGPGANVEAGVIPSLEKLGYNSHDIKSKPSQSVGGTSHGRQALSNPQPHRGRCSCSVARYLSAGCLSRRELFACPPGQSGLDQTLVRGELLWNEYWRLRQTARNPAPALAAN